MEIARNEIGLQEEPNTDFIDLRNLTDINRLFSEINHLKSQLADLSTLKARYSALVNGLFEVTIENSWSGEWLSRKAIELGSMIQKSQGAYRKIKTLEKELTEKYGFLYEYQTDFQKDAK